MPGNKKTYIVEHLDDELGPWSELEYTAIARETARAGGSFVLSSVPSTLVERLADTKLASEPAFRAESRGVEELYPAPEQRKRVCLLDPRAEKDISPDDKGIFDVFLFGGILGDDPPRDRTSELRVKGYEGRRLGPVQMTTDTAVRVTRMVIEEQFTLGKVPYVDHPDLKINEHESTEMPFRYVKGDDGEPVMPEGMIDLIKQDADKSIDDLI
ncbi:SAM-dependent RNA methyltransferase [Xylaria arbuscula]|nr:SAM-dependent RNA methyltransferase [Xylaria arbuscula]